MLIYHPVYDINHCLFRFLLILEKSNTNVFQWELFRLMDFYLLFPNQIKKINPLPNSLRAYKKIINEIPVDYEVLSNSKRIFFDLQNIQSATVFNLIAKGLLDADSFEQKRELKRTSVKLPNRLQKKIDDSHLQKKPWFDFVTNGLSEIELLGNSGIKSRSGLMEFKYDISR